MTTSPVTGNLTSANALAGLNHKLSGRRSLDQVRALAWDGDPEPYLELLAPYPMPASPLVE